MNWLFDIASSKNIDTSILAPNSPVSLDKRSYCIFTNHQLVKIFSKKKSASQINKTSRPLRV